MTATILITGFGPFPGAPYNPTQPLVRRLVRRRHPAFAGVRRIAHVFPVSYEAVDRELPALIAAKFHLDATVLYRRPNIRAVDDAIGKIRQGSMGRLIPTGLDAPVKLGRILEAGGHVAMLVDQHYVNGVDVTFFGRRCKANPFIARLARHIDCPIHGTRIIRLPDRHRFRVDLTEAIEPRRDAAGKVDIAGTMQAITSVVEAWVREHPEQWLWLHRRWR